MPSPSFLSPFFDFPALLKGKHSEELVIRAIGGDASTQCLCGNYKSLQVGAGIAQGGLFGKEERRKNAVRIPSKKISTFQRKVINLLTKRYRSSDEKSGIFSQEYI